MFFGSRRWTVRLHFFGAELELPKDGDVAGRRTVRGVRASDVASARQAALSEAERDLAKILQRPVVERLRWSVESIERRSPERSEAANEFFFYKVPLDSLPEPLADLADDLTEEDLWLHLGEDSLSVHPERDDAYGVSIRAEGEATTVSTDDWHAHYEDPEQAVACFRWLLTPFYRTVAESQDGVPSAAWIERWEAEGWRSLDEVILRNPTDPTRWLGGNWRREYRQQAILRPPQPYNETVPGARLDRRGMPRDTHLGLRVAHFPHSYAEECGWLHADYDFDPGQL